MTNILAIIAGATYSAAYIMQRPYCFYALAVSVACVVAMRLS